MLLVNSANSDQTALKQSDLGCTVCSNILCMKKYDKKVIFFTHTFKNEVLKITMCNKQLDLYNKSLQYLF